jgi:hypothetical protein
MGLTTSTIDYSEDDSDTTKVMEDDDQTDVLIDYSQALGNHRGTCDSVKRVGSYAACQHTWNGPMQFLTASITSSRGIAFSCRVQGTIRLAMPLVWRLRSLPRSSFKEKNWKVEKTREAGRKKRTVKKDSNKGEFKSGMMGASVFAFEQLWAGTIIDSKESKTNGKQYMMRWDGFKESGNRWVSEHEIVTPTMPKPERVLKRLAAETYSKCTCGDSDKVKAEEVVAPPPPSNQRISLSTTSSSTINASKEDASTKDKDLSFQQDDESGERVTLKDHLQMAEPLCDTAIKEAKEGGDDCNNVRELEMAKMTKEVLDILKQFPSWSEGNKEQLVSQGPGRELEASIWSDYMNRWNEAEKYCQAAVNCLMPDTSHNSGHLEIPATGRLKALIQQRMQRWSRAEKHLKAAVDAVH